MAGRLDKKRAVKSTIFLLAIAALFLFELFRSTSQIFFINRTLSMPIGIYIRSIDRIIETGDVIVFYDDKFKGKLIKYVSAISPSEVCLGEEGSLWVDGFSLARINIEKYPSNISTQSECYSLAADELLALGDHPDSYDSRYFGPIKNNQVIAQVELLWQFK